jgi:hypothetical protein
VWLGPDDDAGLNVRHAATVAPVVSSIAAPTLGPAAAPTVAANTNVTTSGARAGWTAGDGRATTRVEYRRVGDTRWTVAATALPAGVTTCELTGLGNGVEYEWRAAHERDSIRSAYLGPVAGSTFTTSTTTIAAPSAPVLSSNSIPGYVDITATWANAENDAATEVYLAGPNSAAPVDADYVLKESPLTPAASSSAGALRVSASGTYWVRIRQIKSGFTPSAFAGPTSIAVVVTGEPE